MQIDENLALAARRGAGRTLRIGITKKENAEYHELLKTLGLGLEDRMTSKVGLLSGGQRQAVTLLMATLKKPSCCCWTSTPQPWTPRPPPRCWKFPTRSCRKTT